MRERKSVEDSSKRATERCKKIGRGERKQQLKASRGDCSKFIKENNLVFLVI